MDKMKFETPNLTAENLKKLAELFPGVVTEGKVNVDLCAPMWARKYLRTKPTNSHGLVSAPLLPRQADHPQDAAWLLRMKPRLPARQHGKPYCSSGSRDWTPPDRTEGDNLDAGSFCREPSGQGEDDLYRPAL